MNLLPQSSANSCEDVGEEPVLHNRPSKAAKIDPPEDLQDQVANALRVLLEQPTCSSAWYLASRSGFRVRRRTDKALMEFHVKDLQKARKRVQETDDAHFLERKFNECLYRALQWLEDPADDDALKEPEAPPAHDDLAGPAAPPSDGELAGPAAHPADGELAGPQEPLRRGFAQEVLSDTLPEDTPTLAEESLEGLTQTLAEESLLA